jgi:hypothetical protein
MSSFTPGPWLVSTSEIEEVYGGRKHLCIIGDPEKFGSVIADIEICEESGANARLIAAAPDLYNALKMIVENMEKDGYVNAGLLDDALKAIVKAEDSSSVSYLDNEDDDTNTIEEARDERNYEDHLTDCAQRGC